MDNIRKQYDIGVIIGRFQIHELHSQHRELIDEVLSRHKKILIFLGISPALGTRKNPLDFATRRKMLDEAYGDQITAIMPIHDKRKDSLWSKDVDTRIREVFPVGSVVLYGSRESFLPYYEGSFDTCELEATEKVSATEIRNDVSQVIDKSKEFRAGVIYGVYNTFPQVQPVIDVAIFNEDGTEVLLGRKPLEKKYRFIGGFVDIKDESNEAAAIREVKEETGLEIGDLTYVQSLRVNDWRYNKESDRSVMTNFYTAKRLFGIAEAKDDIVEVKWVKLYDINESNMVDEHLNLLQSIRVIS